MYYILCTVVFTPLARSDRGPIRVQYSKNPLGRKRDAEGRCVEGGGCGWVRVWVRVWMFGLVGE